MDRALPVSVGRGLSMDTSPGSLLLVTSQAPSPTLPHSATNSSSKSNPHLSPSHVRSLSRPTRSATPPMLIMRLTRHYWWPLRIQASLTLGKRILALYAISQRGLSIASQSQGVLDLIRSCSLLIYPRQMTPSCHLLPAHLVSIAIDTPHMPASLDRHLARLS